MWDELTRWLQPWKGDGLLTVVIIKPQLAINTIRDLRKINYRRTYKTTGPWINKKWQRLIHFLDGYPRPPWSPWLSWGQRSQGNISLWPPGLEELRHFPVEEELGDWPTLSEQSGAINFPVSCLSTVWASPGGGRVMVQFYPVVSIATIKMVLSVPHSLLWRP